MMLHVMQVNRCVCPHVSEAPVQPVASSFPDFASLSPDVRCFSQGDLASLRRTVLPLSGLVQQLQAHAEVEGNPVHGPLVSPLTRTYLSDVKVCGWMLACGLTLLLGMTAGAMPFGAVGEVQGWGNASQHNT